MSILFGEDMALRKKTLQCHNVDGVERLACGKKVGNQGQGEGVG